MSEWTQSIIPFRSQSIFYSSKKTKLEIFLSVILSDIYRFFLSRYGKVRLLDSMLEYNLLEEVKTESRGSKSAKKQKIS